MSSNKEIANVILDIIDREKRLVKPDPEEWGEDIGTTEELRMQLREVAFALIGGKAVKSSDLF